MQPAAHPLDPLEDWTHEDVVKWLNALPEKFAPFTNKWPPSADGEELAVVNEEHCVKALGEFLGRSLYARLAKLPRRSASGPPPVQSGDELTRLARAAKLSKPLEWKFTSSECKTWFVDTFGNDVVQIVSGRWPSTAELFQDKTSTELHQLRHLFRAADATLAGFPPNPEWCQGLKQRLSSVQVNALLKNAVTSLLDDYICMPSLVGQLLSSAYCGPHVDPPATDVIRWTDKHPQFWSSVATLLDMALDAAKADQPAMKLLTEFDITIRFLSLLLDFPIWLRGIDMLNEEKDIKCEWLRTRADATVTSVIPDGQLRVAFKKHTMSMPYTLLYIEDKRTDSSQSDYYNDLVKALTLARHTHELIVATERLSLVGAMQLVLPVVLTRWPEVKLLYLRRREDSTFAADILTSVEFYDLEKAKFASGEAVCKFSEQVLGMVLAAVRVIKRYSGSNESVPAFARHVNQKGKLSASAPPQAGSLPTPSTPSRPPAVSSNSRQQSSFLSLSRTSHGDRAFSLRLFIKQPRLGSLELEIIGRLGGAHHIPSALPHHWVGSLLAQCELHAEVDAKHTSNDSSSASAQSSNSTALSGVLVLPYLPDRRAQSFDELRLIGRHLAEALQFLHAAGYVHRDVKRPNVRFTGYEAFLIDFDVAAKWHPGDQLLCGVAGTPQWRAPEVEAGIGYDSAADMYGLGLVLLEEGLVISGSTVRVPYIVMESFQAEHVYNYLEDAPSPLVKQIYWLLYRDPRVRPTANEIVGDGWFTQ